MWTLEPSSRTSLPLLLQLPNLMLVDPKCWKNLGEFLGMDTIVMRQDMVIPSYRLTSPTGHSSIAKVVFAQTKA